MSLRVAGNRIRQRRTSLNLGCWSRCISRISSGGLPTGTTIVLVEMATRSNGGSEIDILDDGVAFTWIMFLLWCVFFIMFAKGQYWGLEFLLLACLQWASGSLGRLIESRLLSSFIGSFIRYTVHLRCVVD